LHSPSTRHFSDEHLKLMVAIGHQAALAVEDTSYYSAMVQAERLAAMGQTIAGLSHHIKNILQGIRGGSYLIQEGLKAQDWQVTQRGWGIVEKNQDRISSLVLDMLTFSKEREPEMVSSDLNEVVGDVLELMAARAGEHGVTLVDRRQGEIPLMTFDPEGLHRAVLNVVTNAIDAAASGEGRVIEDEEQAALTDSAEGPAGEDSQCVELPRVEVATAYLPEQNRLVVTVRDNGVGIPIDQQQRIFNAFVSSKGQRGTGLGLPVSQKIMEEHGGQIKLESETGKGSCFTLELPAIPAREATTANFAEP
ncbi:MAG: hypothetical protein KDA92_05205, partial [Planctomycetales bacterium]|nr:hypothetical protein [Planctomycetales bacterium]